MKNFTKNFYLHQNLSKIDYKKIDNLALNLEIIRKQKGRLFILGVGGSAGNEAMQLMIHENFVGLKHTLRQIMFPN